MNPIGPLGPISPMRLVCGLCLFFLGASARADTPPLLAKAFEQWNAGAGDLAFTQRSRIFADDGVVKIERLERYDPSLPDSKRWRLLEVDGKPATDEERRKWETRKNSKARKQVAKALTDYLDITLATPVKESATHAQFDIPVRPETARLLDVDKIGVTVTIDKEHGNIAHIAATLREPIRVLLGLAKITDFDLDVGIDPPRDDLNPPQKTGDVKSSSTARVMMSKFGDPVEYRWSDFKRVQSYAGPKG